MKIVVIGGVAAGTKTAAKLMRQDRSQEVVVYTKGKDISYAGCGLPYYVGGMIESPGRIAFCFHGSFPFPGEFGQWDGSKKRRQYVPDCRRETALSRPV